MYNRQQGQYTSNQWQQIQQQQQWQQMQQMQQMNQSNQAQNPYTQPAGYVKKQGCGCGSSNRTTR